MTAPPAPSVPHAETLPLVRGRVRDVLESTPAYWQLSADGRRDVAQAMVNIGQYLVDAGGQTHDVPMSVAFAQGQGQPQTPPPDTAGAEFAGQGGATAGASGTQQYADLISKVDFPKFVSGLIDGVFNAIVTSSIKQMEAYAEMVKNVSKSVDQYMKDNVSENQARDYLADRYPDHLEVAVDGDQPKLQAKDGADTDNLPDFFKDLGLSQPVQDLDDDTVEQVLVPGARKQMAMDRQKLLLTMVLMGINRLVVTDGSIKASVVFDLKTRDSVTKRKARTTDFTQHDERHGKSSWWSGWFSPSWTDDTTTDFTVSTVNTDDSSASSDLKAKLSGDVNIRFKSETFPLDRMTDILGVQTPQAPRRAATAAPPAEAGTAVPVATH